MKAHFFEYVEFNMKLSTIMILSILTALKHFVGEYIFSDVKFMIGITILFTMYTISGAVKAWVMDEFSLALLFEKSIQKGCSYILFIGGISAFIKLKVEGETADWVQYLDDYLYMGVGANLVFNIIKNVNGINPGMVPEWISKMFREAAETGKMSKPVL